VCKFNQLNLQKQRTNQDVIVAILSHHPMEQIAVQRAVIIGADQYVMIPQINF
jgi:hypothetical protein